MPKYGGKRRPSAPERKKTNTTTTKKQQKSNFYLTEPLPSWPVHPEKPVWHPGQMRRQQSPRQQYHTPLRCQLSALGMSCLQTPQPSCSHTNPGPIIRASFCGYQHSEVLVHNCYQTNPKQKKSKEKWKQGCGLRYLPKQWGLRSCFSLKLKLPPWINWVSQFTLGSRSFDVTHHWIAKECDLFYKHVMHVQFYTRY